MRVLEGLRKRLRITKRELIRDHEGWEAPYH